MMHLLYVLFSTIFIVFPYNNKKKLVAGFHLLFVLDIRSYIVYGIGELMFIGWIDAVSSYSIVYKAHSHGRLLVPVSTTFCHVAVSDSDLHVRPEDGINAFELVGPTIFLSLMPEKRYGTSLILSVIDQKMSYDCYSTFLTLK